MIQALDPVRSALLKTAGAFMSSGGGARSLLVLIYHRVLPRADPLLRDEPDAAAFAGQMDLIRQNFNILPLSAAVERLARRDLPTRAVCITFDDGYANNCEVALPILSERGIPATVFVAPGFLSGGRMFNDTVIEAIRRAPAELDLTDINLGRHLLTDDESRTTAISHILPVLKYLPPRERLERAATIAERVGAELPSDLMMTAEQVRRLHRAGIEIGAHTVNHPILAKLDDATALLEIGASKHKLQEIIGAEVTSFAYPNGGPGRDYTGRDVALARQAGFRLAVSTAWGAADARRDPFQIPRIAPWDRSPLRFGLRMARAYGQRTGTLA
jgi:peptidoglycan/xylan/chitin deacetylase (PgdA/CDA1 family)